MTKQKRKSRIPLEKWWLGDETGAVAFTTLLDDALGSLILNDIKQD